MPRLRRPIALVTASALLLAACTTREGRIGYNDGSDACYQRRVELDSTGDFFAEDIIRGAVIGAAGGAVLGGLIAAARGGSGRNVAAGAGIGALAGGAVGAAGGYLAARQRQARDQAELSLAIANDLGRENAELDRTQIAFNRLMDCRFQQAQMVREAYRRGQLPRPAAEAQMARLRAQAQEDIAIVRRISERVTTRGAEFDTAIGTVAPEAKEQYEARKSVAARSVVAAQARQTVPLRLRPEAGAPEVGKVDARQAVQIRPAQSGYALVETADGQRGYAPTESFGTRGSGSPMRIGATSAAPATVATTGDVRTLAASNIAQRDNFAESVRNAESATSGGGFELAS